MKILELHPETPQKRFVKEAAKVLDKGGLVVYPTDSGYSVGCDAHNVKAIQKLYTLKKAIKKYVMALMLPEIKQITEFANMDNQAFRYIKSRVPGHYTFILPAQTHMMRKLGVKRKEVGVRIPDFPFLNSLFEEFPNPILNTAAKINEDESYIHPDDLERAFKGKVDLLLTMGEIQLNPTNVISLLNGEIEVLRGQE